MNLPLYACLDLCLLTTEVGLAWRRRSSRAESRNADRGSLRILWLVTSIAMTLGHYLALSQFGPSLRPLLVWQSTGGALFAAGLVLRFWAIRHLGRFFTVDVSVAPDHRIVNDGPFRYVRHPSYTGLLLEFAGIGLALGSLTALAVILVPILTVLLHRIRIEEGALREAFGLAYSDYMKRTKRLLPGVY